MLRIEVAIPSRYNDSTEIPMWKIYSTLDEIYDVCGGLNWTKRQGQWFDEDEKKPYGPELEYSVVAIVPNLEETAWFMSQKGIWGRRLGQKKIYMCLSLVSVISDHKRFQVEVSEMEGFHDRFMD